jgi:hypothetical protein
MAKIAAMTTSKPVATTFHALGTRLRGIEAAKRPVRLAAHRQLNRRARRQVHLGRVIPPGTGCVAAVRLLTDEAVEQPPDPRLQRDGDREIGRDQHQGEDVEKISRRSP